MIEAVQDLDNFAPSSNPNGIGFEPCIRFFKHTNPSIFKSSKIAGPLNFLRVKLTDAQPRSLKAAKFHGAPRPDVCGFNLTGPISPEGKGPQPAALNGA